jgi:hypothetical protein
MDVMATQSSTLCQVPGVVWYEGVGVGVCVIYMTYSQPGLWNVRKCWELRAFLPGRQAGRQADRQREEERHHT